MAIEKLKFLVTADTKNFALGMKAVGALAVAAFAAAIKVSAEFEKELSKLRAVSGANVRQMGKLEAQARELGKATAFTAVEVAGLQVELAKLGFTSKQILQSSGGILDLAAALGVQLSEAASLTGTSIRAFGLAAEDTGRVVDVLAKAAASSALDFSTLTEGLKDAAPIAKLYNFTIEDTVAMLGQLANAGIKGSKAGVALRQIFLELDKKGIKFSDALKQVNESGNAAATAMELVGKRAAGAFAIIANGQDDIAKLAYELYGAEGAAEAMRKTMEDNLFTDLTILKSAFTNLGIEVGNTTHGPLRDFLQWGIDFINGTKDTLGALDSLTRAWYFLQESMLLAGRAAELAYIAIQVNNPFGDGLISKESLDRLQAFNDALDEVNAKIIKISNYGTGGGAGKNNRGRPEKTQNTVGEGGAKDSGEATNFGFGFASFFEPEAIQGLSTEVDGFLTRTESKLTSLTETTATSAESIKSSFDGIGYAAGTAAALVSQLSTSLLGTDSSAVARIAASLVSSFVSIAIAGAVASAASSSTKDGPFAIFTLPVYIGIGLAAIAAGLQGSGGKVSGSGGGSRSPASSSTISPNSVQGNGGASGQLVASVRGQDLRFVLQAADDSYGALS